MTKIISFANHKGGVGKTTTTANVGAILAAKGYKVLLLDLDAQSNLTSMFGEDDPEVSVFDALTKKDVSLPVVSIRDNLDLIPSSLEMIQAEPILSGIKIDREFVLSDKLESIKENYDYILIDCPPSLGMVVINGLVAATHLIVTVSPEVLPTNGLDMITDLYKSIKRRTNPYLNLLGIVLTKCERGNLYAAVESKLRQSYETLVFSSVIRKNVTVATAPLYNTDVVSYDKTSNGAKDYTNLTNELISKLK